MTDSLLSTRGQPDHEGDGIRKEVDSGSETTIEEPQQQASIKRATAAHHEGQTSSAPSRGQDGIRKYQQMRRKEQPQQ